MFKALLITAAVFIMLWALAAVAIADDSVWDTPASAIAPGPGSDLDPTIAVDQEGQVAIAWKRVSSDGTKAEIMVALSPHGAASSVIPLDPSSADRVAFSLVAGQDLYLTWSQTSVITQTIWQRIPLSSTDTREKEIPGDAQWVVDSGGSWHAVWARDEAIHTLSSDQPLTVTVPISPATTIAGLTLATDGLSVVHASWALRDAAGESLGIFYAPLVSGTLPIQISADGHAPRLVLDPTGRIHLLWLGAQGLTYANSVNWTRSLLLSPGPLATDSLSLVAGRGNTVYAGWIDGESIWYANVADWECSLKQIPTTGRPQDLALAMDGSNRLHMVWAIAGQDGSTETDLTYLSPTLVHGQIAVVLPAEGDMLTADAPVQVVSNLPSSEISRIEFFVQASYGATEQPAMQSLGIDRDGRDGWTSYLRLGELENRTLYRILALATTLDGTILRALGGWFTVQKPQAPATWFRTPAKAVRGETYLAALIPSTGTPLRRLDVYLAPVGCQLKDTEEEPVCLPPDSIYLGSYEPLRLQQPIVRWEQFAFDSQRLPDGLYRPAAIAVDTAGKKTFELDQQLLQIENALAPKIEIISPSEGTIIEEELQVSARLGPSSIPVRRMDFYLEHREPILMAQYEGTDHVLDRPHVIWIGGDTNGSDGWGVRVPIEPEMDGDDWRVRAVAFADRGLATSVLSAGPLIILGRPRPYASAVLPSAGSKLKGLQTIRLFLNRGSQYLAGAEVYVQDRTGALTRLGALAERGGRWVYDWDTRTWPDGTLDLMVIMRHTDGRRSIVYSEELTIENRRSAYLFREPSAGSVVSGTLHLRLAGDDSAPPLQAVNLYYRDKSGALAPIDHFTIAQAEQREICATWDTATVLDDEYELVAYLTDALGQERQAISQVTVRNVQPVIAFQDLDIRLPWTGFRRISWNGSSPVNRPLSVTVEYSPDNGEHWMELARDIPATESFLWDTEAYPDSSEARLRATVSDGLYRTGILSPPFSTNNDNESPVVALLTPQEGQTYHGPVPIVWEATDADGDALMIDLAYRRGDGAWATLAERIPNSGTYVWNVEGLPPGDDYEVRVSAVDPRSALAMDIVKGIALVVQEPPRLRLTWPHGGTRLEKDAVILWQATDPDNDDLRMDLYYSDNAGQTWIPLAEDIPNTGYYQWQTSFLPMGTQYRVRVVARDGLFQVEDQSKGTFTIGAQTQPKVSWVSPSPGSRIRDTVMLRWWSMNISPLSTRVTLMARRKSQEWITIVRDLPDDGFYLWNTNIYLDGEYDLQVVISDGQVTASAILSMPVYLDNEGNHAPKVVLLSPQGGEFWTAVREITWDAVDADGDPITATISSSVNGGRSWDTFATVPGTRGHFLWDTGMVEQGRDYLLRVSVTDGQATGESISGSTVHVGNKRSYPPSVLVFLPETTGKLAQRARLSWISEDPDGDPLSLVLALSQDGGITWQTDPRRLFNAGQYTIDQATTSPEQELRLWADDGVYQSEVFASLPRPRSPEQPFQFTLESPKGGERWSGEQEIRWKLQNPDAESLSIDIEWSSDGSQTWVMLADGLRNTEVLSWDTSRLANGVYFLRLTARTNQGIQRLVSEPFTLDNVDKHKPVISLIYPQGDEIWLGTREIRWQAMDDDGDPLTVNLAYSVDRGTTWQTIAFGASNTGSYIWDTTTVPNASSVWLRATVSDGQYTAQDTTDGPFAVYNLHAPVIKLLGPGGGIQWTGRRGIAWVTTQEANRSGQTVIEYSTDLGRTWQPLATGLPNQGEYVWDTSVLPNNTQVLLRVLATDGVHTAVDVLSQPVTVKSNLEMRVPFYLP